MSTPLPPGIRMLYRELVTKQSNGVVMDKLMELIPPEQLAIIVAAFIGVVGAFLAAIAYLFRWYARYFTRVQDEKLNAIRQERELEKVEFEAKLRRAELDIQTRLDETHNSRETIRMAFSELDESRKDDAAIRASYERRETAYTEAMARIASAMQGIEANAAASLGLLKDHRESDDIVSIKQEKIIVQNDKTQAKLVEVSNDLSSVLMKLEGINVGRVSDRKLLEEIHEDVKRLQGELAQLKESADKMDSERMAITLDLSKAAKAIEITESKKEFSDHSEEKDKPND